MSGNSTDDFVPQSDMDDDPQPVSGREKPSEDDNPNLGSNGDEGATQVGEAPSADEPFMFDIDEEPPRVERTQQVMQENDLAPEFEDEPEEADQTVEPQPSGDEHLQQDEGIDTLPSPETLHETPESTPSRPSEQKSSATPLLSERPRKPPGDVIVRVYFPRGAESGSSPEEDLDALRETQTEDEDTISGMQPVFEAADTQVHEPIDDDPTLAETQPNKRPDPSWMDETPAPEPTQAMQAEMAETLPAESIDFEHMPKESVSDPPPELIRTSQATAEGSAPKKTTKKKRGRSRWIIAILALLAIVITAASLLVLAYLMDALPEPITDLLPERGSVAATATPASGVLIEPTESAEEVEQAPSSDDEEEEAVPSMAATATLRPTATPELDVVVTDEGILQMGVEMVMVPGGSFMMGAGSQSHMVTLDAFYIDRTEVTTGSFEACVEAGECTAPSSSTDYQGRDYYGTNAFSNHPVIYVNWQQANEYCQWRGTRLPTEAEWEMAARWDPETGDTAEYPWGNEWDPSRLNFCDASCLLENNANQSYNDTWPSTARVGSFPSGASAVGALDMAGNVSEWVADWYGENYYAISPRENPTGPEDGVERVVRGGAWGVSDPDLFLSAVRSAFEPDVDGAGTGFRCAVSTDEIEE